MSSQGIVLIFCTYYVCSPYKSLSVWASLAVLPSYVQAQQPGCCAFPGNDAALAQLLSTEASELANSWRRSWDLEGDSVSLPTAVTADNPLLSAMLALHRESCRLLYNSGASTWRGMKTISI